jgi:hypothetical protein
MSELNGQREIAVDLPGITMVSILAPGYLEDSGQAILSKLQERPMGTQPT